MKNKVGAIIGWIGTAFLILAMAAVVGAGEKKDTVKRYNKTSFGQFRTAVGLDMFLKANPGYKKSDETGWVEFVRDRFDYGKIWAPAPEKMVMSKRTLSHMGAVLVTSAENACGTAPRLLFLKSSDTKKGDSSFELFAFEYNICDTTGLLSPEDMVDRYIAKYGMYEQKDYDRNMIVYTNVTERYKVGARPFSGKENERGLTVTVVDDKIFENVYRSWRGALRKADKSISTSL
ncbi:hypothetical protein MNBD_NITROSPINAE03-185 [hydrothermal vent metagenome]|uniref:Uncharacterized protein n=1 Tax=hydrothermal vent metagenome TaxID=652676 RepID=A0A3B1BQZ2_9ZZZZ